MDNEIYDQIHKALGKALLDRIKGGEATAADLNVARQFLKDNAVTSGNAARNRALRDLAEILPFTDDEPEQATSA